MIAGYLVGMDMCKDFSHEYLGGQWAGWIWRCSAWPNPPHCHLEVNILVLPVPVNFTEHFNMVAVNKLDYPFVSLFDAFDY